MGKIGYTVILDWMYRLDLRLPEIVCLSIIFGFSQDGEGCYRGSRGYLAMRMVYKDKKSVDVALRRLQDLGLITKHANSRSEYGLPEYRVTDLCRQKAAEITDTPVEKMDRGMENRDTTNKSKENKEGLSSFYPANAHIL